MIKIKNILILLFLLPSLVFAQSEKDSILNLLNSVKEDSSKIALYFEAASLSESRDEALKYNELALSTADEINDVTSIAYARYKIGVLHYFDCSYRKATESLEKSLKISIELKDSCLIAYNYYFLALSYKYWGKYNKAVENAQLGININEKIGNEEDIAGLLMVSAYIYAAWNDFYESEKYCIEALNYFEKQKDADGIGFTHLALGNVFLDRGQLDTAYFYYNSALKNFEIVENNYGIALCYRDIGRYFLLKKDYISSEKSFNKSLDLLVEQNNNRGISELYVQFGNLYSCENEFEKAVEFYQKGQQLAISMELMEDIVKNYKFISEAFEKDNAIDSSLKYYKLYSEMKDSVFNSDKFEQISELETKYETDKKQQQIALQNLELEKNKQQIRKQEIAIVSFFLIIVVIFVFSILLYRQFALKKKANILLMEQNIQIKEQNEEIEQQRNLVVEQRDEILAQKDKITDSIVYARRIQNAILTSKDYISENLKKHFIIYLPKDIVSGDFYWCKKTENQLIVTVADCTGHGVPGAFMSILAISLLNKITGENKIYKANEILESLRIQVKTSLNQDINKKETNDGLDISLIIFENELHKIQYSGANNPLIITRKNELIEYKATKNPIGVYHKEKDFVNDEILLQRNDTIYLFSDGFIDQFGGEKHTKFKSSNFKNLLVSVTDLNISEKKKAIEETFYKWKGINEQLDDILILAIEI